MGAMGAVQAERSALSEAGFRRELLGLWEQERTARVLPLEDWQACVDANLVDDGEPVTFGVDISPDRTCASIAACGMTTDGLPWLDVVENSRGTTEWVIPRLKAVLKAGTRYARVPEPGACAFCLMLGSRGAAYTSDSVFGELGRYHDNCRCLGIEVKTDADLPQLNRDLMGVSETLDREFDGSVTVNEWRQYITARRQQLGQNVEWPRLQYCRVPRYKGDGFSSVFTGEKLPPLDKMPGHVLHGWRDLSDGDRKRLKAGETVQGWPHDESFADGHRWDSEREGASKFPRESTDQKIVDAVRDVIESPEFTAFNDYSREVWSEIDGEVVYAKYVKVKGREKFVEGYAVGRIPPRARKVVG